MSVYASSALSSHERSATRDRLGADCFVCGSVESVDVAHIIPQGSGSNTMLLDMRTWAAALLTFSKKSQENFMVLCPSHHRDYDDGKYTLVPTPAARADMIEHELTEFAEREQKIAEGRTDTGRTLWYPPQIEYGFEYIPISKKPLIQVFNETAYRTGFVFTTTDTLPHPGSPINVHPYALLAKAHGPLSQHGRFKNTRTNSAAADVIRLLSLYHRPIGPAAIPSGITPAAAVVLEDAVSVVAAASGGTATMPGMVALPGIPAAPHGGVAATSGAVMHGHGQGSSVQTPTDETEGGIG
ncbi:hypothetical protein FRC04_006639, partial [Tulasnella sp. 424]